MKTPRWTGPLGVAAVVVYLLTTAAGSLLDPRYTQLRQHVSDLTATGAPTRAALAPPYLLYNVLALGFAFGLYLGSDRNRWERVGFGLLSLNAFAGVMMVFPFAEDLGGVPTTLAGKGHVAFAGVSSLAIVVGSFVYGVAFRRRGWAATGRFSSAVGAAYLVLGPLAVAATAARTYAGLAERGPIGLFLLWLLVVGVRAWKSAAGPTAQRAS